MQARRLLPQVDSFCSHFSCELLQDADLVEQAQFFTPQPVDYQLPLGFRFNFFSGRFLALALLVLLLSGQLLLRQLKLREQVFEVVLEHELGLFRHDLVHSVGHHGQLAIFLLQLHLQLHVVVKGLLPLVLRLVEKLLKSADFTRELQVLRPRVLRQILRRLVLEHGQRSRKLRRMERFLTTFQSCTAPLIFMAGAQRFSGRFELSQLCAVVEREGFHGKASKLRLGLHWVDIQPVLLPFQQFLLGQSVCTTAVSLALKQDGQALAVLLARVHGLVSGPSLRLQALEVFPSAAACDKLPLLDQAS